MVLDKAKHKVPEVDLGGFRSGERGTHCTRERFDNGPKNFIPIPNGSQGAVV